MFTDGAEMIEGTEVSVIIRRQVITESLIEINNTTIIVLLSDLDY